MERNLTQGCCGSTVVSSFSRSRRARTGERPPDDTAIISGERSIIDGMAIKLASFGASTTLQKIRCRAIMQGVADALVHFIIIRRGNGQPAGISAEIH